MTPLAKRVVVGGGVALVAVVSAYVLRDFISLDRLAAQESQLRAQLAARPAVVYAVALLLYVFVTGLSLPFATVLSVLYGWLFGFWPALGLVSFGSTGGATCAFLLSRYLFGEVIRERYAERAAAFDRALEKEGAFYLFSLRLVPYVPFFVVNLAMGLTKMRVATFWWVSQVGMLPATVAYLAAASSLGSLREIQQGGLRGVFTPQLIASLTAIALLPWVIRWGLRLAERRAERRRGG